MAVAQLGRLIGGDQPVARVLSNRLQQVVARRAAAVDHDERASDEATERVERVEGRVATGGGLRGEPGDLGRRLERAAPGEDGEAPEQPPLVIGQQVPAPVDQRLEGLLSRQRRPSAAGEQAETVSEPQRDLLHRQERHPGGRQLDGQWDAVQAPADLDHGRSVGRRQRE